MSLWTSRPRWRRPLPDAHVRAPCPGRERLRIYLLKPSKYDDEGAVLSFRWGVLPSNTLAVLAALVEAHAAERREIDVETVVWDEVVDGAVSPALVSAIVDRARRDGVRLLIGLAGVQTNQYPRARDLALAFRTHGAAVAMGGFHVSSHPPTRAFLAAAGVTTVVGEAETTLGALLDDLLASRLRGEYRMGDGIRASTGSGAVTVPDITRAPLPTVRPGYLASFLNPSFATIDTSRGCPFVCTFCSVKNVMGRRMRSRDPAALIAWVRDAHDRFGIRNLLVVDDDFYRNPEWRPLLRGFAELRREGRDVSLLMQVDVEAALPRRDGRQRNDFVELASAAGCFQVFVGLESFEPENLCSVAKLQNTARAAGSVRERYAEAVARWHRAGVAVHAAYIIGLPHDGPGCGRRAAHELAAVGVDLASFFVFTPFPGTEDYVDAVAHGEILDHDFDRYDATHPVRRHPRLEPRALAREYREAWRTFYTWRRLAWGLATWHRVPGLTPAARSGMVTHTAYYTYSLRRGWHPMLGGVWRRRSRVRRAAGDGAGEGREGDDPAGGTASERASPRARYLSFAK